MRGRIRRNPVERFMEKVQHVEGGHWLWLSAKNYDGTPLFWDGDQTVGARRYAYKKFVGAVEPECDVRPTCVADGCVSPKHLTVIKVDEAGGSLGYRRQCKFCHIPLKRTTRDHKAGTTKAGYPKRVITLSYRRGVCIDCVERLDAATLAEDPPPYAPPQMRMPDVAEQNEREESPDEWRDRMLAVIEA